MHLCRKYLPCLIILIAALPSQSQPVFQGPATVDFGDVPVGRPAGAGLLVCFLGCAIPITNNGNAVLTFTDGLITGNASSDFGISNGSLGPGSPFPINIAPGQKGFVQIIFIPSVPGLRAATLTLQDNASGSPHEIAFTGTGIGNGDFGISQNADAAVSASIVNGQKATYDLAVSAGMGFSGTVAVACSGLPRGASCSIAPGLCILSCSNSFSIVGPFEEDVTVFVSTTAPTVASAQSPNFLLPWSIFAALCVGSIPIHLKALRKVSMVALGFVVLSTLVACNLNSSNPMSQPPDNSTPKGTFAFTATATSGNVTRSQQLTLVVQ